MRIFFLIIGINIIVAMGCDTEFQFINSGNDVDSVVVEKVLDSLRNYKIQELPYEPLCGCFSGGYKLKDSTDQGVYWWHFNWCDAPDSILYRTQGNDYNHVQSKIVLNEGVLRDSLIRIIKKTQ